MDRDPNDRWHRVDEVFRAALDVDAAAREAFVEERCGGDVALGEAVRALLDASERDHVLAEAHAGLSAALPDALEDVRDPAFEPGHEIGGFRILERIGRGGQGSVYLAERTDPDFRQVVAIKVVRRGLDTADIVERFRAERRILASLQHPAIARLLDGGTTDDGRPYLVMEHIEGRPLAEYCDAERLSVRERLELFCEVGEAVQYAHRHLVVHRDLKPSNILVTEDGVKLLDFGIAKVLSGDADLEATPPTRTGLHLLTPDYASPEQLRGEAVTTASDVFQLGLLLYELLTGTRPFAMDAGLEARAQAIETTGPRKPSAVFADSHEAWEAARARDSTPTRIRRTLAGDLDTIVLQALRAEPERRYTTAGQMVEDVERHLQARPVNARPDTWVYRTRKLLTRRPWIGPTAAAVLVALLGYGVTVARHAAELERERNLARAEAAKAQEVQRFLIDVFRSPDPYAPADPDRGRQITVAEALAMGTQRVRSELGDRPAIQAELLGTVSEVYHSLDLLEEAVEIRRDALQLEVEEFGPVSPEVSRSLIELASLEDARGNHEEALALLDRQQEVATELYGPAHADHVDALKARANVHLNLGDYPAAESAVSRAAAQARGLTDADPMLLVSVLWVLAGVLPELDREQEALAAAEEALDIARNHLGEEHPETALAMVSLAGVLDDLSRHDESAPLYRRALDVMERSFGPDHSAVRSARNNLAVTLDRAGDYEASVVVHREVLAQNRRIHGEVSRVTAESMQNLGVALGNLGAHDEAIELHQRAAEVFAEVLPPGHFLAAFPLLSQAGLQLEMGRYRDAEAATSKAETILAEALPPGHYATAMARCRRGRALAGLGRDREALALLRPAVARIADDARLRPSHREECKRALARVEARARTSR